VIDPRPIGFFVHHQGHGHVRRTEALVRRLAPRQCVAFCAAPERFDSGIPNLEVRELPDPHGAPPRTAGLLRQRSCITSDCAPLGVDALRHGFAQMASWMSEADPLLFVADVSSEVSMLARLCSVPSVTIRMHGDRTDLAHRSAYSSSVGLLAPFDERLEDPDFDPELRARTRYVGGLVDPFEPVDRDEARRRLGLDPSARLIVASSGGGGAGSGYASLTVGARAEPDAQWLVLGHVRREGHETDFANLRSVGWVDDPRLYFAAADIVVSACGDNLVHEVVQVGRPLLCIPEWCYYDEQRSKARALQRVGAAAYRDTWPGSFRGWRTALAEAAAVDVDVQRSLVPADGAEQAAAWIEELVEELWAPRTVLQMRTS